MTASGLYSHHKRSHGQINDFTPDIFSDNPVADPGFPRGGGANSPGVGGCQHTILQNFTKKLHEIERIRTPLDPPLQYFLMIIFVWNPSNHGETEFIQYKQEYIQVGCVLSAAVAVCWGVVSA